MLSVCNWVITDLWFNNVSSWLHRSKQHGWWTGKDVGASSHGLFWGTAWECLEGLKKTTKEKCSPGYGMTNFLESRGQLKNLEARLSPSVDLCCMKQTCCYYSCLYFVCAYAHTCLSKKSEGIHTHWEYSSQQYSFEQLFPPRTLQTAYVIKRKLKFLTDTLQ